MIEAEASHLPMLELLAARDWKRHVLVPSGRDPSLADSAIDAACEKMRKSRDRFAGLF